MIRNTHTVTMALSGTMTKPKKLRYKGLVINTYSIGWLSVYCALARVTLRGWERKGIIPKPLFTVGGRRLYTPFEIEHYAQRINAFYAGHGRKLKELANSLHIINGMADRYYKQLATNFPHSPEQKLKEQDTMLAAFKKAKLQIKKT